MAISSTAIVSISVPVPVPPCSSPNGSPRMSFSANRLRMSHGYSADASMSCARGATFSCDDLADRVAEVEVLLRDLVRIGGDRGHGAKGTRPPMRQLRFALPVTG